MQKNSGKIWPIGIGLSFVLIIALIVVTIKASLNYPVEDSDANMMNYHEADANINEIIREKIAFDKLYNLNYVTKKLDLKDTVIEYKVTDKSGNSVNNATIKAIVTRPDTHDFDISLENPTLKEGVYSFKSIKLPKQGRWNVLATVTIGDNKRYINIKADTRNSNFFEY